MTGVQTCALPISNVILLVINFYYLVKIYRKKENFDLVEFKGEEKLATKFLSFYQRDIAAYFPVFNASDMQGHLNFVVIRDLVIANIFSAQIYDNGDAEILINYTVKKYRDYKVGRFIFEKEKDYLVSKGIKRIVYKNVADIRHEKFLKVMGFIKQPGGFFVKVLNKQ